MTRKVQNFKDFTNHEERLIWLKKNKPKVYAALKNPEPSALLAANIIDLRIKNGLSTRQLSKKSRISWRTICYIESLNGNPTMRSLERIAHSLGVKFIDLFAYVDLTKTAT